MKVKEFAEAQGITAQAVYQRLKNNAKKNNKQLSDYVSGDTSEITEDGYKILQSLYKQPVKLRERKSTVDNGKVNELSMEVEKLNLLIKSLETRLQDKDREIEILQSSLDHERQMNRSLVEAFPRKGPGFIRRLFSGKSETGKTDNK